VEAWTATKQDDSSWLFTWDYVSGESFEIWLDGVLLDTVSDGEYTASEDGYDDAPPPLEIIDATLAPDSETYPPYVILQWREVSGASGYQVDEYVGGSWVNRRVFVDASAGYYWYKSDPLDDDDTHIFRVSALDLNGNAGTAVQFTYLMARNPAPPEVTITINGSNDVAVGAA
jgi:hypothetical protein